MFKQLFASVLLLGAVAQAPPAHAQMQLTCLDREMLIQRLVTRYNESLNGAGMQGPKIILEIWSSEDSGSFTILVTKPDGQSCIVASGLNWQTFDTPAKVGITG